MGFTYVESSSNCFLKSALGTPIADPGATSGSINPPSATATAASALPPAPVGGPAANNGNFFTCFEFRQLRLHPTIFPALINNGVLD